MTRGSEIKLFPVLKKLLMGCVNRALPDLSKMAISELTVSTMLLGPTARSVSGGTGPSKPMPEKLPMGETLGISRASSISSIGRMTERRLGLFPVLDEFVNGFITLFRSCIADSSRASTSGDLWSSLPSWAGAMSRTDHKFRKKLRQVAGRGV